MFETQSHSDFDDNAIHVLKYIDIPEPDDAVSMYRQHSAPLGIGLLLIRKTVLASVEFDNEHGAVAGEVGDGAADGNLTAKVKSFRFEIAKL